MVKVYIEYQEHGKYNARALMFLLDLSSIKHEEKVVNSIGCFVYGHSYGLKITYNGHQFYHIPTFIRLIARETGMASENESRILVYTWTN